jgi:hypothetical protein
LDIGEYIGDFPESLWGVEELREMVVQLIEEGRIIEPLVTHFYL